MTEKLPKFRLSLEREFYDIFTHMLRPGRENAIEDAKQKLRGLEIEFEEASAPFKIEFVSAQPRPMIMEAVRGIYSVYEIPPERPMLSICPTDFLP